jgi:acyl-CoA thioester hydrolase
MPPVNKSAPGPFSIPVRVYYEDTDTAGVVYYANYLRYLERGRTEWLRTLGIEQLRLAQEAGLVFAVRSLAIEYLKPARLDDVLAVLTELTLAGRAQVTLRQWIERAGDRLVEATVRVACLDAGKMKPAALPADLRRKMGAQ